MAVFQTMWNPATTYSQGDLVNYSGVVYEALNAVPGSSTNMNPCNDTSNWKVSYVERVESLTSILEYVRAELNVDDPFINNSVIEYVNRGAKFVNQKIRLPSNLVSTIVTTRTIENEGYDGRLYVGIPGDLLEVENLRINSDTPSGYGLLAFGTLEILSAQSDADFETLIQYYTGNTSLFGYSSLTQFSSPLYRYTTIGGVPYFEIAPPDIGVGTDIEIRYWKSEPELGSVHPRINTLGQPLNDQGQTQAEWVAAGNMADTFVQQQVRIEDNWFTNNQPYLIAYAALYHASAWLKDIERAQLWKLRYDEEEQRVEDYISAFRENRPIDVQMSNPYSIS